MATVERAIAAERKRSPIRWGRIVLGAVLSEVAVILLLLGITLVYSVAIAPGLSQAQYGEFGRLAGYYIAPTAGAISTFVMVLMFTRRLTSGFVANGTLTGIVSVLLTVGFIVTAKPEDRLMYGIAFVLRIAAGYLGGLTSQKMSRVRNSNANSERSWTDDPRSMQR
jgi:hypothetical protein